jgi:flagellin-like protein
MNKNGLSEVIATVLLILLTVIGVGIIMAFVIPLVQERLKSTGSCFGVFDKMKINREYTCTGSEIFNEFEEIENNNDALVSIETGKITLDGIIVVLTEEGESKSFEIKNNTVLSGVSMYKKQVLSSDKIQIPGENSGRTYRFDLTIIGGSAKSVQVRPIVNGQQCDVSDSIVFEQCAPGI